MAIVKILMNAMPGHISVRLRKIVIIKYHFISVPVTWGTSTTRMVIALILTSALMAITTVTQMPTVSIVMAVIHVVVILGIVRVSTPNIPQFILLKILSRLKRFGIPKGTMPKEGIYYVTAIAFFFEMPQNRAKFDGQIHFRCFPLLNSITGFFCSKTLKCPIFPSDS